MPEIVRSVELLTARIIGSAARIIGSDFLGSRIIGSDFLVRWELLFFRVDKTNSEKPENNYWFTEKCVRLQPFAFFRITSNSNQKNNYFFLTSKK